MAAQRADALWAGWGGTALFLASWLLIASISAFSFPLWIGLMLLGAVMCFYGASAAAGGFFFPASPLCLSWLAFLSAFTTGSRGWGPWLSRAQDGTIRELVSKGRFFP